MKKPKSEIQDTRLEDVDQFPDPDDLMPKPRREGTPEEGIITQEIPDIKSDEPLSPLGLDAEIRARKQERQIELRR